MRKVRRRKSLRAVSWIRDNRLTQTREQDWRGPLRVGRRRPFPCGIEASRNLWPRDESKNNDKNGCVKQIFNIFSRFTIPPTRLFPLVTPVWAISRADNKAGPHS